ncbi:PHP domain-containing protein [Clostridium cylindrosporum]|uniref:Putative PHP domain-containing protein n=1 Tax=Clostridium cylindrosporum DSM 605 TaxID=1121307 RepID=A0A0J8DBV2_CLOCY|nr:PHP domain-containing protein [Clostridium cylindrosporum]KMT21768.1 putative PHP domain-containing protein [Clostridium cylindrosporum DSM 605]
MYKADLHVHSSVSDCNYTVDEIIDKAKDKGLTHMAFTEHDTTRGSDYAVKRGKLKGINIIPGIEISAYDRCIGKKVHILGYNYKGSDNIRKLCNAIIKRRNNNCIKQIKILQVLGYDIKVDEVMEISGECMYKQHILDYLHKTGQTDSLFGDIYKKVFSNRGACDFDIEYVNPVDAVKAIRSDGGYAVLAHPGRQGNLSMVFSLIEAGLNGIELNHHGNSPNCRKEIEIICKTNKLFMTGGSDYHGEYSLDALDIGINLAHESSEVVFN